MTGFFGFSLIRSGFVSLSLGRRENSGGGCIDLLAERESGFRLHISFHSHATSLHRSVFYTHTPAVIKRSSGILEGSSLCVFITVGGIASSFGELGLLSM